MVYDGFRYFYDYLSKFETTAEIKKCSYNFLVLLWTFETPSGNSGLQESLYSLSVA